MLVDDVVPLGFRLDGQVIWPYAGGSEGAPEGAPDDGGDDGGDGGGGTGSNSDVERLTKAINDERALTKQARDGLRPWLGLARDLGVKGPDEIRSRLAALNSEQQDHAAAIDAARAEVLGKANARIVKAEIKVLAAKDFADPADAATFLKVEDYEVDDDGNVDAKSIKRDLADLLRRKPHLAAVSKKVDFEGGARKTAKGTGDMNETIRNLRRR